MIGGLALWEGEKWQYPLYDTLAMGVQMMLFTYLMGRTDSKGRTVLESWAAKRTSTRSKTIALAIAAVIVVGHLTYAAVFLPHLITKLAGYQKRRSDRGDIPGLSQPTAARRAGRKSALPRLRWARRAACLNPWADLETRAATSIRKTSHTGGHRVVSTATRIHSLDRGGRRKPELRTVILINGERRSGA